MSICLIYVGIAVVVGIGLVLMLWGRHRVLRGIGVLLSSVLGAVIAWIAGNSLFLTVGARLWRYAPREGNIIHIGQDITLDQMLWIPLQDKCFSLVVILFFLIMLFGRGGKVGSQQSTRGYTVDDFLFDRSLDRFLDNHRPGAKLGGLAYQVVIVLSVLFSLPVTGLIAYGTLQMLLSAGVTVPIQGWIIWSICGTCVLFALLFLFVNGVVALWD